MAEEDLPPVEEDAGGVDAPVEEAPQEGGSEPEPTLEDVASTMGWSPQEKWRGDPDKWKPAHEFVQNTADINSKLTNRLSSMEQRLDTMARTSARVTEQQLAKQREELLSKRNEAFETGDAEAFNKVDKQLTELNTATPQSPPSQAVQSWTDENANWYGKDQEATNWAQNRAGELAKQGLGEARQLSIVAREAKALFPELFPAPEERLKPKPAPLSQPGKRANNNANAKTYANLPPEAKAAADDFHKRGRCTREEYAKTYFEMEA